MFSYLNKILSSSGKKFSKERKVGVLFLGLGILLIIFALFWNLYQKRRYRFDIEDVQNLANLKNELSKPPVFLEIPSLDLKLPVEESQIINGIWQVSDKGVSHLNLSANLGDNGNIVIYGHNKKNILGSMRFIKTGSQIYLKDEESKVYKYRVVENKVVSPKAIEYVLPKEKETLTIYTCTGFADSMRFIVIAEPLKE